MNMKIDQFLKAAKRYSANANIPLSQAQELLSTYFGHKNFHAASQALVVQPVEAKPTTNRLPAILVICGVSGIGKTTLASRISKEDKSRRFIFAPDPVPGQKKFDYEPDWNSCDVLVIDEVASLDRQSFLNSLLKIEFDCTYLGKTVLIVTQDSKEFFRLNFENALKTTPAYCELVQLEREASKPAEFNQVIKICL